MSSFRTLSRHSDRSESVGNEETIISISNYSQHETHPERHHEAARLVRCVDIHAENLLQWMNLSSGNDFNRFASAANTACTTNRYCRSKGAPIVVERFHAPTRYERHRSLTIAHVFVSAFARIRAGSLEGSTRQTNPQRGHRQRAPQTPKDATDCSDVSTRATSDCNFKTFF